MKLLWRGSGLAHELQWSWGRSELSPAATCSLTETHVMTRQPLHRRALRIELPGAEPAPRASAPRRSWRAGRSLVVTAIAPTALRAVVTSGLRALSFDAIRVTSCAGLLGIAARADVIIMSDPFDRAPALPVIAALRTAGYFGGIAVIGHASRALRARADDLHVTLVGDPITGSGVSGPWLRQCLIAGVR
jgi:hypothetical protein